MVYCTKCGKQNPDTAKFCTGCGIALQQTEILSPQHYNNHSVTRSMIGRKKILLIAGFIIFTIAVIASYFIFKKEEANTLMLSLPDKLNLRSSQSDASDENVVQSVGFGTELEVVSTEGDWAKVRVNGNKGFMKTKYLALPIDFYKVESLIKENNAFLAEYASQIEHPVAIEEAITETRYKLSLLRYFKKKGYAIPLSKEIKEKYSITDTASSKQNWKIHADYGGAGPLAVALKGSFNGSSKRGLAVFLENADTKESKFVFFSYDDYENEVDVSEFSGKKYFMYMIEKPDKLATLTSKDLRISPEQDVLTVNIFDTNGDAVVFYFLNGKMVERVMYYN